jgi:signal peptidase II
MTFRHVTRQLWVPLSIALVVIVIDQVTKALVLRRWPEPNTGDMAIIEGWLDLTYIRNTGVAFGLFGGIPQFFTVTSLLIVCAALYLFLKHRPEPRRWFAICLGLIVGGAIGNVIDRLRFGYVVDFIKTFDGRFPVFNIADSCVVVGVGIVALLLARSDPYPSASQRATPSEADDGV